MQTLMTSTSAGSLFTSQPPFSTSVTQQEIRNITNPLLIQTELGQPEGTPLQLIITNLNNASQLASQLNQKYQAGQLKDAGTGEPLEAWAGYSTVAQASGTTLTLRWRKGQPFIVPLLWGLVVIIAIIGIYFLIRQLMGAHWSLSKSLLPSTSHPASNAPLGVPWWEWIAGAAVVVLVGPFAYHEYDRWVVARGQTRQDIQRYGPL